MTTNTLNTGAASLSDEQILEHFEMPGLNLEATLDAHDIGLLLTGIRTLLATTAQADAAPMVAETFIPDAAMNFAAFLIDHCEGETITEESLQVWLGKMVKLPRYNPSAEGALASMTRMFHAACADLGAINEALGLDPDDGGAEPILEAIAELRAAIAAGGAQEPIYQQQYCGEGVWRDMPKDKWDEKQAGILASDQRFRIVYAAPLLRVAATVALTDEQREAIMEQAQVFASAWSLVGGPFDYGGALETAEQEKENLRALLAAASTSANVAQGAEAVATVKVYETYTGQDGWIEVTQEEYDRTKDKYEHRIRRVSAPPAQTALTGRVLTYRNQPDNVGAWQLGEACRRAAELPAGDYIDRGLGLLKELQAKGYGVIALTAAQSASGDTK
jgi:hypothetical protein